MIKPTNRTIALGGLIGIPAILLFIGSAVVVNALIYAILVVTGFGILVWKMRASDNKVLKGIYNWMKRHPWTTDFVLSMIAFLMSPGGITGMLGASIAALFISCTLLLITESEQSYEKATCGSPASA